MRRAVASGGSIGRREEGPMAVPTADSSAGPLGVDDHPVMLSSPDGNGPKYVEIPYNGMVSGCFVLGGRDQFAQSL